LGDSTILPASAAGHELGPGLCGNAGDGNVSATVVSNEKRPSLDKVASNPLHLIVKILAHSKVAEVPRAVV